MQGLVVTRPMMRRTFQWIVAVAAVTVGAYVMAVGATLLPSWTVADARGTTAQLTLTWILIGATALAAVLLAGFLFRAGTAAESPHPPAADR